MVRLFEGFRFGDFDFEDWISGAYEKYSEKFPGLSNSELIALVQAYATLAAPALALEFFSHDLVVGGIKINAEVNSTVTRGDQ